MPEESHSALLKWNSCSALLDIPKKPNKAIKRIHIYDFDNTLYNSPHPNAELYVKSMLNQLSNSSIVPNKSWWNETKLLKQSFDDMLECNAKQKKAYWNEDIIKLANLSHDDPETVSIMLTGRKEHLFAAIFTDMFLASNNVKFNAYCLRRESVGSSTNDYKIVVIRELLENYSSSLEEIKLYDDRLSQTRRFESLFASLNPTYEWKVIHVPARFKLLRPEDECRIIQATY